MSMNNAENLKLLMTTMESIGTNILKLAAEIKDQLAQPEPEPEEVWEVVDIEDYRVHFQDDRPVAVSSFTNGVLERLVTRQEADS